MLRLLSLPERQEKCRPRHRISEGSGGKITKPTFCVGMHMKERERERERERDREEGGRGGGGGGKHSTGTHSCSGRALVGVTAFGPAQVRHMEHQRVQCVEKQQVVQDVEDDFLAGGLCCDVLQEGWQRQGQRANGKDVQRIPGRGPRASSLCQG